MLPYYSVTLKADGQRVLLAKYAGNVFVIPSAFTAIYLLHNFENSTSDYIISSHNFKNKYNFLGISTGKASHGFEYVLDVELVYKDKMLFFYIFDYLYFCGNLATNVDFKSRYTQLQEYFSIATYDTIHSAISNSKTKGWPIILLKEYVPVNQLCTIIPPSYMRYLHSKHYEDPECKLPHYNTAREDLFPVDGIIFQHSNCYRYGLDKRLYKWKPIEYLTIDFRVQNSRSLPIVETEPDVLYHRSWISEHYKTEVRHYIQFDLFVLDFDNKVPKEVQYNNNAVIKIESSIVAQQGIRNGVIIEARKKHINLTNYTSTTWKFKDTWEFLRVRVDKNFPNKKEVALSIEVLDHLPLESLIKVSSKVDSL